MAAQIQPALKGCFVKKFTGRPENRKTYQDGRRKLP